MTKPKVMQRRRQLLRERKLTEANQQGRVDAARNAAAQSQAPVILLQKDRTLLSREWLMQHFLRRHPKGKQLLDGLPGHQVVGPMGHLHECFDGRDVERAIDAGQAGITTMGRLEIFEVRSLDALNVWDRRALDIEETYGTSSVPKQGCVRSRFRGARSGARRPEERWVFDGERGPMACANPAELIADHPIEVGFDHARDVVLWIRSLGHQVERPAGEDTTESAPPAPEKGPGMPELEVSDDMRAAVAGAPSLSDSDEVEGMEPGPARRQARNQARKHGDTQE